MNLQNLLRATNHLQIAQNEFEMAKQQLQAKGINIPSSLLKLGKQISAPAGNSNHHAHNHFTSQTRQQNLFNGGNQSSAKKISLNFSDQKTPNGHPYTFLYRAHINLNEHSSCQQPEYEQAAYNQNVSQFCDDEEHKMVDGEQPLRLTN